MNAVERVREAYRRNAEADRPEIWITLRPQREVEAEAAAIDARVAAGERLPLAGRPLAVKGNIDIAGVPTTAACPSYAYLPERDAPVVTRLRAAGAVVLGATNLDQFATGLVGTRSPYGAVRNAIDPERVSGGSSSGSAVAVALGIADLALGTDTAGSGRVPAAFNGIVGLKPTPGTVCAAGVVPACASIDCVSVFARSVDEAELAYTVMAKTQPRVPARRPGPWRVAVPPLEQLGELDPGWAESFQSAAEQLASSGAELTTVDLTPFSRAAELLYRGAFVAERYTAVGAFVDQASPDLDPTVAAIISAARGIPAHRLFADQAELVRLRAQALVSLGDADALLLPTTPGHPTLAEVAADPVGANSRLGRFTNSTNLFGFAALAVPAGTVGALPFGVMLISQPGSDPVLATIARLLPKPTARLAVFGAHLSGQPLNPQLRALRARLLRAVETAPGYRLHALPTDPPKPGLVRVTHGGSSVTGELWELPTSGLGALVAGLPRPMAIGPVELADGSSVPGFLCEHAALADAPDITHHGGWRAYREAAGQA